MEWHPFLAGARLVRLRHMKLDGLLQPLAPSTLVASLPFLAGTRSNERGIPGCLRTFTMLWMRGQCIQVKGELVMPEHTPVIAGAVRIPTGKFPGSLASFTAPQRGAIVIKPVVRRSGISPDSIDEVITGNVVSAGIVHAPARQAASHAGLPAELPASTV